MNNIQLSNTYAANNGNLTKTTYGNGAYIENVYDVLDRIVQIKYNGSIKYKYAYNGNGDLYEIEDVLNNTKYRYEYDSLDRLCASYTMVGTSIRVVSDYTYDGKSRVTEYTCGMVGATGGSLGHTYGYVHNDENGTMTSMTVTASGVSDTLNYTYDPLQRMTTKNVVRTGLTLAQTSSYKTISGNRTSTLISGVTQKINGSTTDSYTYTYDSLGNITAINRSGYEPISYTYDAQNQLIKVVEGDFRYEYAYDTYGNLLSVKTYDNSTSELLSTNTYTYGNSQWLDRLTKYNGETITYDEIGNPSTYYNGSDYEFTWRGRELAKAVKGGVTTTYKYGADGLRTQKKVGSTTYNYYYADGLLIRQTWGSNYMDFLYDESGSAYSFIYNGTQYYYVRNLQGDVVKILNTSGGVVASYTYDAWGKVSYSGSIGQINPIRYRGYYYDTDTGFYYLQSRYYDPAIKRFINADDASLIGANGDFISFNLYAYCLNNPVMCKDESGYAPEWLEWTLDIGLYAVSAVAAAVVGRTVAGVTSRAAGLAAGAATFGALNNLTNAVYYNCISDGESDLTSISHADKHINRWKRLDYTKKTTQSEVYNSTARMYYAEYDVHVAGYRLFEGSNNQSFSELAERAENADIDVGKRDSNDWKVFLATIIFEFLGL